MLDVLIQKGSIITVPDFLDSYKNLDSKKDKYEYSPTYQPNSIDYGNRFQATPCYETANLEDVDSKMNTSILKQLNALFDKEIINFHCRLRCTKTSELRQSPQYKESNIAMIHTDTDNFAGVLPFAQSFTGGTAFFEHSWDKFPDIYYGAYPNRLVLYRGKRNHAACQDFTFEDRFALILFFDLAK